MFKKLFCKHDYKEAKTLVVNERGTNNPTNFVELMECNKCGDRRILGNLYGFFEFRIQKMKLWQEHKMNILEVE